MLNTTEKRLCFRTFAWALNLTRFSIFILIAIAALLSVNQGLDLLRVIHEKRSYSLYVGTFTWSFSIWL